MLDWLITLWPALTAVLHGGLACAVTVHAVLWKRDSRAAIAWVGVAWLAPLVGSVAYLCFGINRIQRKALTLRVRKAWRHRTEPRLNAADRERIRELGERFPNLAGLAQVGHHLTGRHVVPGNRVEPLVDDETFGAMLQAIDGAERSVTLLSYIFDSDRAGDRVLEALVRAGKRGVEVRVLIDDVGSRYSRPNMVTRLRGAGLVAATFLPTRFLPGMYQYANLRNHRKILVVDGRIGFTGGTNIREGHWLSLNPRDPIRCVHFQIEGPIVTQMQEVFALDWAFATGEALRGRTWFAKVDRRGDVWARGIPDGPDEDFEKMTDAMIAAVTAATRSIHIVTPYFLPDAPVVRALNVAAMRGVDVRIYLPQVNNIRLVAWACNATLWQVLEKGCRVFFLPPPFEHTKLLVVDGVWSLIGSTNWDPRSLRLNFEYNLECYDEQLAHRLERLIRQKGKLAHETTLEELSRRSLPIRLRDGMARLATPYL